MYTRHLLDRSAARRSSDATKSAFISPNMSWSRVFRLPQIYKDVHHSSSRYRCSLDSSWLTRNFVGPNSTRNGWDFSYEFQGVMTRCESSVGSFGKCGDFAKLLDMGVLFSVVREIVVQFNADVADGMQWQFVPTQREVRVKPGESALAFYTAENQSSTPITGESTYNVTLIKTNPKLLFALFRHDSGALFRDDSEAPLRLLQTRLRNFFSDTTSKLFFALEDYPVSIMCPRLRLKNHHLCLSFRTCSNLGFLMKSM
ncbi:hypothetical protein TEA_003516 [Camellia sinensis var. sinensis]|uniref:Uncharacterized protein n=1 Tax=Camellia sinensis var. sinensis TaxID=542762 RepID=A0A4S4DT54_CAMSN|nr:hypothetical protein TEA_003516 [Camellia sinensis var. sinensis]